MAFLKKGKARQGSLVIIGWKRYWYLCTCSTREMAMSSSRPLLLRSWSREQNKFSLSNKIFLKRSERVASVSCKACKIPEICQTFSMLAILKIRALCHSFAHELREERSWDWEMVRSVLNSNCCAANLIPQPVVWWWGEYGDGNWMSCISELLPLPNHSKLFQYKEGVCELSLDFLMLDQTLGSHV